MTGDDISVAVLGGTCSGTPSFTVDAESMVSTKTVNVAGKWAVPAGAPLGARQETRDLRRERRIDVLDRVTGVL